jgi:hypothetical protein
MLEAQAQRAREVFDGGELQLESPQHGAAEGGARVNLSGDSRGSLSSTASSLRSDSESDGGLSASQGGEL